MGTDIHGVFQRHNPETKTWEDVPHKFEMDRHYPLFAVLAGVRNGTGFAGVPTGEAVTPIAPPRGYPPGFVVDRDDYHPLQSLEHMDLRRRKYHSAEDGFNLWMGDHTQSWLTAEEMLAWFEQAPTVVKTGILSRDEYAAWDKATSPDSYCGGVSGSGVVIVQDNKPAMEAAPNGTYVQCTWECALRDELAYFFDEVRRLKAEHGAVRFVFGFDS